MRRAYDQFIIFGDSTIQQAARHHDGFSLQAALQDAYIRRLDIVNRGFGGYNTHNALEILHEIIPDPNHAPVRFFLVALGTNDAVLPEFPHHVPLPQYRANLRAILTHPSLLAHSSTSPRLILVTPAPVCEAQVLETDRKRGFQEMRRVESSTARYAQVVRDVGGELGVPVLDLWALIEEDAGKSTPGAEKASNERFQGYFSDGVHYKRKTYEILFHGLMDVIGKSWPEQMPDRLEWVFPKWNQLPPGSEELKGRSLARSSLEDL